MQGLCFSQSKTIHMMGHILEVRWPQNPLHPMILPFHFSVSFFPLFVKNKYLVIEKKKGHYTLLVLGGVDEIQT